MTRVHPLLPDEDSLSPHLLLSALYIQRMQMKLWACLTRNIWEFANVSICRLIPQKIIPDTKNCAKHLLYCSKYETCHAPEIYTAPSRGIGLTTEITTSLYTCCFILHDIGPICCYYFYCGFPPSQSMHSDLWIKSRVHLKRLKSRRVNRFGAHWMPFLHRDGVQKARAAGEGYLKLHLTEKSGVMLLVFQILQERSIITPLKTLAVGQFKVQLLIK